MCTIFTSIECKLTSFVPSSFSGIYCQSLTNSRYPALCSKKHKILFSTVQQENLFSRRHVLDLVRECLAQQSLITCVHKQSRMKVNTFDLIEQLKVSFLVGTITDIEDANFVELLIISLLAAAKLFLKRAANLKAHCCCSTQLLQMKRFTFQDFEC